MVDSNFMLAGSASSNTLLFVLAVALILAWKAAGRIGANYFLPRWVDAPWRTVPIKVEEPAFGAS